MTYFPIGSKGQTVRALLIALIASSVFAVIGRAQIPPSLNVAMVESDPTRPFVYGLHQNGASGGTVVVFNTVTRTVTQGIPVGNFPTDLAVRSDGSALYVLNSGSKTITKIDLGSLTVVKTTSLTQFGTWGSDITVTPGNIGLGPGDVVYYTDGAWGPALHAINFETGQHLQKTQFKSPTDSDGFGDFVVSPDGTQLFAWKQYGWSAGVLGTYVARFGISGAGLLTYETSGPNERLGAWDRDPLDTPALMDASGETLLIKNRVVDQSSPLVFPRSFPEPAYAMSSGGRVVGAVGNLYDATTTDVLSVLPDLGTVQCFSRDGSLLIYFKSDTKSFVVVDLVELLGVEALGVGVSPPPFSVGPSPETFDWFARDGATSYRVFLGANESAVESAGPGSALIIGETSNLTLPTPSLLNPGTYYWRVDAITPQGTTKGDVVSFSVSPLSLSMGRLNFGTLVGVRKSTRVISVVKSGAAEVAWTASPNHPWLSLVSSSGTTPSSLQVVANVAGLNVGLHEGSITVVANGAAVEVPVSVRIAAINYTHLEADGQLPYVYGISQVSESATSPAHLLRIDAGTGEVLDSVEVGSSVTDLEVHYQENRLYVTNWMTGKLRALDRTTLEEVQEYPFVPFGGTGYGEGDVYRISAGKAGRLVVEEQDQWIDVNLFNTTTGAVLDTAMNEREGGGIFDPTGRYYYHGDNNSSGSEFHRFDTNGDNFVELAAVRTTGVSSYGSRNVKRSADGTRYYWNGTAFDAQLNVLWTINEEIQEASLHGDVVFTPGEVRTGVTGAVIASLPVSTSVMALGGNQENLFLASGGNLTVVDLSTLVEVPGPGIKPGLVDASTVLGVEQTLRWSLDPFASAYKVYFGTSLAAVQAANEASVEFLGTATGGEFALPSDLALGGQYFWRVDAVGFLGTATGPVWSFDVAPVEINPSSLSISIPSGLKLTRKLEVSAAAPTAWSASVLSPGPLALNATHGTTPGFVEVTVDAGGLAVGSHTRSITFTAGGKSFVVPVIMQVLNLNYTHLEADAQMPYIYGISQVSESATSPAHLLKIDVATGLVLDAVPVGSSVSDLEIHYPENRIYVTNWMTGKLRALDRTTLQEVQVYPFVPFGGTGSGTGDAYRISAGKAGRLVVEEEDQWIDVRLIDTATGAVLDSSYEREGGGVFDPTGRYYYHGDNNSSGSEFHRFDTNGDNFVELKAVRTTGVSYYGSRTVKRSADGTRYYWNGTAFDAQLNVLWTINEEIQAVSQHGDAVFTPGEIRNGTTGAIMATLPVSTSIMAINGSQRSLFLATGANLTKVDLSTLIDLPGAGILPSLADGSTVIGVDQKLAWSLDPFASAYKVYFGTSLAAVQSADETSDEFLGTVSVGEHSLPWNLVLGERYFWRVDAVGFLGAVTGPTWSFDVAPIEIQPSRLSLSIPAGLKVTRELDLSAATAVAWTASVAPSGPLALSENGGTTPASLQVTINAAGMTVGAHSHAVSFTAAGKTFTLPVEIEVLNLNYTHLEADGQLPYIYGITQVSETSTSPAHLVRINATNGQVMDAVPVGSSVSDLEVHYQENRIYVTNWMTGKLRALDRTTLEEVRVYPFQPFASGVGGDVYRISAGKAGRLMVEEKDQWIDVNLFNTATGAVLDTSYEREGGGIFDPTGRYYFHGDNNISNAALHRIDTNGDSLVELNAVRTTGVSYYGSRAVERSADGTRYYWNGTAHDAQLNVLWTINKEIQEASLHGDAVFTAGEVRNGTTGAVMASLPSATSIMALAGDQQNLFLASGGVLTMVDLSTILELPGTGMQPSLVDGSTVIGVDQSLGWSLDPFASGYKVYFGTSLAEVQTADESSAQYLGVVNGGELLLPWDLALGGRYFWRVDAVGFLGTVMGPVWSFDVAPIEVHPARLSISLPSGLSTTRELVLSAAAPVTWSASVASNGVLALDEAAGTTPSAVSVVVDVEGLAVGAHSRSITFTAGGKTFAVPVDIEVLNLNYTHLEADTQLPYVYGISQVSESSTSPAFLLRIDAATGAVLDSVPVGSSVSDLEVHYPENRIYVTNWMTGKLRALDRTTLEEVRVYPFVPFGGTGSSGGDVYRIAAGKAGRLIVEEKDQWIDVGLFDTASGVTIRKVTAREGGGATDPTGRYYFHGDNNISDASLRRFDTNGDALNLLSSVRTAGYSYYGDRTVVMTRDGSRVFWNGTAHNASLEVLWTGSRRILAATANGRVVFVAGKALNGRTGRELGNLPVSTSLMVVGFDQEKLFLALGSSLTVVDLGALILPPGDEVVPMISDGSTLVGEDQTLSWTGALGADTYKIYFGQSQAGVEAADETSPEYRGETDQNNLDLSGLIDSGRSYFWRVDSVGVLKTIKGGVWSFAVDPVVLQPDVMVGLGSIGGLGDDLYSEGGENQLVLKNLKGSRSGSIYFWIENDGNYGDRFSLTSTRGNRNLDVTYMRSSPSPANITATITLPGGVKLSDQQPGSKTGLQAVVRKAKSAKGRKSSLSLLFRAISDGDGSVDAARGLIKQSD